MCFSLCLVFLKENNAKIVFFFPCNYHHWFLVLSRIDSCVFWLAQTCYFVLCLFPLFWCVAIEWTSYNWAIQGFRRCSYAIKNLTYRILTLNVLATYVFKSTQPNPIPLAWSSIIECQRWAKLCYSVEFELVHKKSNTSAYVLAKMYPS